MKHSTLLKPIVDLINPIWKIMDTAKIWEIFATKYKQDFVNLVSSPYLSWADILKKLTTAVAGTKYADPITA
jgi:hypothetical protein